MEIFLGELKNLNMIGKVSLTLNFVLITFLLIGIIYTFSNEDKEMAPSEILVFRDGETITGEYDKVTISERLEEGSIYIEGATIENLIIKGGGDSTISFINSNINNISVEKKFGEPVRLKFLENNDVSVLTVKSNTIIEHVLDTTLIEKTYIMDELNIKFVNAKMNEVDVLLNTIIEADETTVFEKFTDTSIVLVNFYDGELLLHTEEVIRNNQVAAYEYGKDGYEFINWITEDGIEYDFEDLVINGISLFAKLEEEVVEPIQSPTPRPNPAPEPEKEVEANPEQDLGSTEEKPEEEKPEEEEIEEEIEENIED